MTTFTTEDREAIEKSLANEPVAWYSQRRQYFWTSKPADDNGQDAIPLYTHPEKHLSLQKVDGELVAVTYTDDEHRIIEVLWEKPPAKILTDDDLKIMWQSAVRRAYKEDEGEAYEFFAEAILRKAQE